MIINCKYQDMMMSRVFVSEVVWVDALKKLS